MVSGRSWDRFADTFSELGGSEPLNGGEKEHEIPKSKAKGTGRNRRRGQRFSQRLEMHSRAWLRSSGRFYGCAKSKASRTQIGLSFSRYGRVLWSRQFAPAPRTTRLRLRAAIEVGR